MFRIQAPFLSSPPPKPRSLLASISKPRGSPPTARSRLRRRGEIAYLQFSFRRLTLAVCSRIRRDGIVEIEVGLGDPRLPKSAFTADQMRQSEAASRSRLGGARQGRPARTH